MSNRQPYLIVVSALIRRGHEVLLVEQQWPKAPAPAWTLPGGIVEADEMVLEALSREVWEETGLVVLDPGRLLYVLQYYNPEKGDRSFTYVFEVAEWTGQIQVADPDKLILQARFLPHAEAIDKLENHLRWPVIREPIVAHLRNEVEPGTFWQYQRQSDGNDALMARLNGSGEQNED